MNTQKSEIIFFDKTESFAESLKKDAVTLATVGILILLSKGSAIWSTVTIILLSIILLGRLTQTINKRRKVFQSRQAAVDWLQAEMEQERLNEHA